MKLELNDIVSRLIQNNIGGFSNMGGEKQYTCNFLSIGIGCDKDNQELFYLYFKKPLDEKILKNIFNENDNIKFIKTGNINAL